MKKLSTVTIAVSAYNEEDNIIPFLKSALIQEENSFKLEKVLVVSDGSTDNSIKKASSVNSKLVEIWDDNIRLGKSTRLNEIYKSLKSDILVQSDCDVILSNPNVVADMIKPIIQEKNVGMCGGNPQPMEGKTFIEKAVNYTCEIYIDFRESIRGGDNVFSADGRLLAFKKELVKKIHIPEDMIANDRFTYFACLTNGYKYKYVKSAIVKFRSPQNLKDQIIQNTRFMSADARMKKYFPNELVEKETNIPKSKMIKSMARQFIKHPLHCLYIFLINRYCQFRSVYLEKKLTAKWDVAKTTKTLLTIK